MGSSHLSIRNYRMPGHDIYCRWGRIRCRSSRRNLQYGGGVAQLVERILSMDEVLGSIPGASNTFCLAKEEKSWRSGIWNPVRLAVYLLPTLFCGCGWVRQESAQSPPWLVAMKIFTSKIHCSNCLIRIDDWYLNWAVRLCSFALVYGWGDWTAAENPVHQVERNGQLYNCVMHSAPMEWLCLMLLVCNLIHKLHSSPAWLQRIYNDKRATQGHTLVSFWFANRHSPVWSDVIPTYPTTWNCPSIVNVNTRKWPAALSYLHLKRKPQIASHLIPKPSNKQTTTYL